MRLKRTIQPQLTTYQKARLQVVGYRTIQNSVTNVLSQYDINTSQWVILGWLNENLSGMRVTAIAELLVVETPLITALLQPLQAHGLIQVDADPTDKRAKILTLSEEGIEFVGKIESLLSDELSFYEKGFKKDEIDGYFKALERFIDNAHKERK